MVIDAYLAEADEGADAAQEEIPLGKTQDRADDSFIKKR